MALNESELDANVSTLARFPDLVVIFTPVLVIQLLTGFVSNLLLITLLVKASSVNGQNNTNIYLYSMAINNLISLFPALTLLISTLTKEWALGQSVCSLNQFVTYMVALPHHFIQACISRERYKAVVHFSEWKPYSKKTYFIVAMLWISALCCGVVGVVQGGLIVNKTDDVLSCYLPHRWFEQRRLLPLIVVLLISTCIGYTGLFAFTAVHYFYTFSALFTIRKVRNCRTTEETKLDHKDIPLSWKAEVRTLKSMACVFFLSVAPYSTASVYYIVLSMEAVIQGKRFEDVFIPLLHVGIAVCGSLVPTASPLLLILINKRFRMRIKDIFRWKLKPTDEVCNSGTIDFVQRVAM